ncbi:mannitol dehydrogenase family protein [Ruegeria pomeroyi]|uniref:D-mannonate oxidoreductase n=2 Tax=Ruegeria pomeroyi TaxID=89184 RepID=Q5LSP1_RUEPO|nr:mannitol dehydrogenase family protein [Ruegeria pomeroyi]HCE70851.1 mannitol dehydrogenase family protein [Ruegeria sp.]AAV95006.1 D-mannonate oxidoreductase [Ruegeria pomeroyi DSS-3]NVK99261.1 mannitol dehydrogenase family protein [Ruegeria pomeroyi]NVL02297.1 mannitol dehydrogenase family protein [Ruegeria pomeroyi]QWV08586.1 mannitol dehydrogenase family protein [Ruegeria pomeroyi]
MITPLAGLDGLPKTVRCPAYRREDHGPGIVHIGLGAFHKAHQAVYTDDALAAEGGNWRIIGVSLRSTAPATELGRQDGLYTVIERSVEGTSARVIGAIAAAYSLGRDRQAVLDALCDPSTRIVSLTVTEKAYGIDRKTGGIDRNHPAIAADISDPDNPQGVAGLLVWALSRRRDAGTPPFTVLCCDNLPESGSMLRALLVDYARLAAPHLVDHITNAVAFPSTMVDRITPARTPATLALACDLIQHSDAAAIECEAFRQWVIEDDFPTGRPAWEAGGALLVRDVRPFEDMKLRMLNGTHSMIAYAGFLAGHKYVRDVMADTSLAVLVERHLKAAATTLDPLSGVDFSAYAAELRARFSNPHLEHETYQIAMDGSEKMPQRIFAPALDALEKGQPLDAFAFATACWLRYLMGRTDGGHAYALRDPRETEITAALTGAATAEDILSSISRLPGILPQRLEESATWRRLVINMTTELLSGDIPAVLDRFASDAGRLG